MSHRSRLVLAALLLVLVWSPATPAQEPPLREAHLERMDDGPAPLRNLTGQVSAPARVWRNGFQAVQVNVDINGNNIVGDAANEPSIAIDPNDPTRIVIGWRQFDTITSNFRQAGRAYSHDGGVSWHAPGVLQAGLFRSDPVLGVAPDGTFYYYSLQSTFVTDMFISDVSGVSFQPPIPNFGGDKAWMTVDHTGGMGHGNLYFAWSPAGGGCCGSSTFTRSTDCGVTYMTPIPQPTVWGTLTVAPGGDLYIAGISSSFNPNNITVAKSVNAQNPGATPVFSSGTVNLGGGLNSSAGPNPGGLLGQVWIDADRSGGPMNGNIYVCASVNPPGIDPLDVNFIRSEDGGQTWSTPVRVNDDATNQWQWFGTMSVAPGGRIDVIWNDTRNDPTEQNSELFYTSSTDGGVTWATSVAVSPAFNHSLGYPQQNKLGDYYDMVSDDLGANIAFAATFNGEQDVYYLRIGVPDCNNNAVDDATDIAMSTSMDANSDGVPDECQDLILSKVTPGLPSQQNALHLTRGEPSSFYFLINGTLPGSFNVPGCPGVVLGIADLNILGLFPTDAVGHSTLSGMLGPVSGASFLLQAVQLTTCNISPVVAQTIP